MDRIRVFVSLVILSVVCFLGVAWADTPFDTTITNFFASMPLWAAVFVVFLAFLCAIDILIAIRNPVALIALPFMLIAMSVIATASNGTLLAWLGMGGV